MTVAHGAPVALAEPAVPVRRSWIGLLFAANLGLWMVFFTPVQVLLPQQISDLGVDGKEAVLGWVTGLGALVAVSLFVRKEAFVVLAATPLVLGFQRVPEPRPGKNRVHIDFASPDRPADVERLAKLGATVVGEQSMQGMTWTVLKDPEGNEFCLADAGSH